MERDAQHRPYDASGFPDEAFDRILWVDSSVGTKLWVGVVGSGPALMLCDGLGCDGFIWKYVLPAFRDEMTLIRWHYRGHGVSEVPPHETLTIEGLVEDLFRVLDAVGVEGTLLAGHSMGVQVILEAALTDAAAGGGRIRGLLPMCGAPGRPLDTFKNTSAGNVVLPRIRALIDAAPKAFTSVWQKLVPSKLALAVAKELEINARLMDVEDLRPYLERLSSMDPGAFFSMLHHASHHSAEERLGQVTVPTLVVAAERDTFTPLHRSVTMHELLPHAELFVLPDATHTGPLEWPDMLHLRMRKFLRTQHLSVPT